MRKRNKLKEKTLCNKLTKGLRPNFYKKDFYTAIHSQNYETVSFSRFLDQHGLSLEIPLLWNFTYPCVNNFVKISKGLSKY